MLIIPSCGEERLGLIPAHKPSKPHYNSVGRNIHRSPPVSFSGMSRGVFPVQGYVREEGRTTMRILVTRTAT